MFDNYRCSTITLPAIDQLPRPHLLCDERDIGALRSRITAGRPRALWNRLQANCQMFQDPASPHCIDVVYREKELNQRVFRAIAELAFADLIEGKRSRGEFAAKVFARVVSPGHVERTWLFKHPGGRHLKPEGLSFGGVFLTDMTRANMDMTLGIAYDLCAPFEGGHKERNHLVSAMLFCDDDEPEQSPQELGLSASHHFFRRGVVVARQDHAEETPVFRLLGGSNVVNQGMQQH